MTTPEYRPHHQIPQPVPAPGGWSHPRARAAFWAGLILLSLSYAAFFTQAAHPSFPEALPLWGMALLWPALAWATDRRLAQRLPHAPAALWPAAALLTNLGLLTLLRLWPAYGLRQALWALLALGVFHGLLTRPAWLSGLRRHALPLLGGSLGLVLLTFIIGHAPQPGAPRLWLGCCGFSFQPGTLVQLTLPLYLAQALATASAVARSRRLPPALFTLLTIGLVLLQRDRGTALVLLGLAVAMGYAALGHPALPLLAGLGVGLALGLGYALSPLVRWRVDAWLHPAADPTGYGYQPLQATLALARGGLFGRGPGLGEPWRVPLAHSDFIFVALTEELGALAALGVLLALLALSLEALRLAARFPPGFEQLLAVGLGIGYAAPTLLTVGGNLRLLPITGLPLPFVAYGGSALLTAYIALAWLLHLGQAAPAAPSVSRSPALQRLSLSVALGFLLLIGGLLWLTSPTILSTQ